MSIFKCKALFLALGILCSGSALADIERAEMAAEFQQQFKDHSLSQIKTLLQQQLDELEKLQRFSSIRFSTGKPAEGSEPEYVAQFDPLPADVSNVKYQDYFNSIGFVQNIVGKVSYLQTNFRKYDLDQKVGNEDFFDSETPKIKFDRIHIFNNSPTLPVTETEDGEFNVDSVQRISAIDATATYSLPGQVKRFYFNHESNASQNDIALMAINGSEVTLAMPREVYDNILRVEAMDKQGKALRSAGSSSYSNDVYYIDQLHDFFSQAIEQVDNGKINTKDQLLTFFLDNFPSEEAARKTHPPKTIASYQFSGEAIAVTVFIKPENKEYQYTFSLKPLEDRYTDGLTTGTDSSGKKYGLIDEQGVWIIAPQYKRLDVRLGDYYSAVKANEDYNSEQIYLLNRAEKKLERQPFHMMSTEIEQDKFVIINKDPSNNFIKGLLNIHTHQILLPLKYQGISLDGPFYIGSNYDDKTDTRSYVVYRQSDNKLILSGVFDDVVVDGDNIITRYSERTTKPKADEDYYSLENDKVYRYINYDIYDAEGTKLNPSPYKELSIDSAFGKDGLMAVTDKKSQQYYIDRQAKKVDFDLSRYSQIYPFSNGLAAVNGDGGKYGYINTQGQLVIPLIYKSANYFQGGTALVEVEDQYQLITPDNKVVATFANSLRTYTSRKDGQKADYTFVIYQPEGMDDIYETYDHHGVLIPND